jgi:hypothetical protein
MLQATTKFRPFLKDTLLKKGLEKFFILDGVGALLGILPGGNRGAPVEILSELSAYCATDGVHYTEPGYANLVKTISAAIKGVKNGTLTKSCAARGTIAGKNDGKSFFWRGYTSPVGLRMAPSHTNASTPHHDNELPPATGRGGRGNLRGHYRGRHHPPGAPWEPARGRGRHHSRDHHYSPYW